MTVTDPAGINKQLAYDAWGNLVRVTEAVGTEEQATTEYVRDPVHPADVITIVDAAGQGWHVDHDPATGDVVGRTDPLGNRTASEYNHLGWLTAVQEPGPANARTTMEYDTQGNVVRVVDPSGAVTTRSYDGNGNLVEEVGPDGTVTVHDYNDANELVSTTLAAGAPAESTTNYDYFPDGRLRAWSVDGAEWSSRYDPVGRLVERRDPLGNVTSMDHDGNGNIVAVTQPGGDCSASEPHGCVRYRYDLANQLTAIEYSDTDTADVAFAYDLNGRRVRAQLGDDPAATWDWTALGQLAAHTDADGRQIRYTWTPLGAVDSILYPGQAVPVRYGYDAAGRMTSVTDWLGNTTSFGYDTRSNLVDTVLGDSPGTSVSMGYDVAGRLAAITRGEEGTIGAMSYDRRVDGLVSQVTDQGPDGVAATSYAYDERHQLLSVGPDELAYDTAGNLVRRSDGVYQAFDAAQQLCWASTTGPGTCASPPASADSYSYDVHGNRTHENTADGLQRHLTYDQANRLRAAYVERWKVPDPELVTERVLSATVDVATPAIKIAGDALRTQNFDSLFDTLAVVEQLLAGLPLQATEPSLGLPETLQNLAATLDSAASLLDTVADPQMLGDLEALVAESGDLVEELSRYAEFGELTLLLERLSDVATELTATVTGLRNELTGSVRLTADLLEIVAALLIDGDATTELHDAAATAVSLAGGLREDLEQMVELGRAIQATVAELANGPQVEPLPVPVGEDWTYRYDADGLRRAKTGPEGTTSFVWDRAGTLPMLLTVEDPGGTTHLVYGPGGRVIEQIGPDDQVLWYHQDHLGSTRVVTDHAGVVVARHNYTVHGTATDTTPPLLGYAGEYTDTETGYVYLRARYYDPTTGQFLTRDPLVAVTQDPYSYAANDPVNMVDPLGLAPWDALPGVDDIKDAAGDLWDNTGGKAVSYVNDHKVGILKGTSWALAGGAIVASPFTAGTSLSALPAVLALGSGGTAIAAEALDSKPNRGERVTFAAVFTIFGGGVSGAFGAGGAGFFAGLTDLGLLGLDMWSTSNDAEEAFAC